MTSVLGFMIWVLSHLALLHLNFIFTSGFRVVYEASTNDSILNAVSVKTFEVMKCFRISYCACYKFLIWKPLGRGLQSFLKLKSP